MTEHILSLSYGKDSMACLGAIEKLGWPLDRIVTADVWATDTIPADLPPMVEFKDKADRIIKERWGIKVEHFSTGVSFERGFYFRRGRTGRKTKNKGEFYGWPLRNGQWCLQQLKLSVFRKMPKSGVQYIGIAADEPGRFHTLTEKRKARLWRLVGQKRTAAAGARKTDCCPRFTRPRHAADVGSAITRAWRSYEDYGKTTRNTGS